MTLRPSHLGNTANNFIGKSTYPADPYFDGLVDDFRIYNRPLAAGEIAALYAGSGSAGAGGLGGSSTGTAGAGGGGAELTVRLRGDAAVSNPAITPQYQLVNNGTTAIPLSDLTVRYWYTVDGQSVAQTGFCDSSQLGCQYVTPGTFVAVSPARTNADYYFQIGFSAAAPALAPGATPDVLLRFNKNDFSNYNETNDYSFNGATATYTTTTNVTVYRSGVLIYGVEPP